MRHNRRRASVLKARATIAWGAAPGGLPTTSGGLKACAKSPVRHKLPLFTFRQPLIPHKPLIELHPILREHRPHLALEIPPLVMRRLPIDVPHQRQPVAQPHRKRRIPPLPSELRELRPFCLDPFGRRYLQPFHHLRDRLRPRDKQRNVNVVRDSTHPDANVLRPIQHRSQIRMHLATYRIFQIRPPILRTEHQMHQHIRDRLRHGRKYSAGLQPADLSALPDLGLRPRLSITRAFSPHRTHSLKCPIPHTFVASIQNNPGILTLTQHRHTDTLHKPLGVLKARAKSPRRPTHDPLLETPEDE
jgi:hypothetical protein